MRLLGTVPERRCSSPLALTLPSPRSSGSGPASDGSGSGLSSGPSNASPLPSNNQEEEEESQSPAAPQFSQLRNLSALFEQGFLLESEYQQRRSQLIDELTGTRGETLRRRRSRVSSSVVLPKGPPDFALIPAEAAVKHTFDLVTRAWQTTSTVVRLDDAPFARGGLRLVYHMREQDPTAASAAPAAMGEVAAAAAAETTPTTVTFTSSSASSLVAKMAIDRSEDLQTYFRCVSPDAFFLATSSQPSAIEDLENPSKTNQPTQQTRDVEMQAHCAHYARLFNSYEPPRAVQFCTAWILELPEREGSPLCAVEVYCPGEYRKHNNNYGYVSDDERNTPQAFSHFTYIASKRSMLVVDIQGVGDLYTDPYVPALLFPFRQLRSYSLYVLYSP